MRPPKTFELRIFPHGDNPATTKMEISGWLISQGWDSFVEGTVDDVDLILDQGQPDASMYDDLGGATGYLSLFKFEKEALEDLLSRLKNTFGNRLQFEWHSMDTEIWAEGWKESFRPITTQKFYIYPPWDDIPPPADKIPVCIEPGMAFGSGQHATTQLCLRAIETLVATLPNRKSLRVCDVGTGSGILAIGLAKLGVGEVIATDVDADAILAAHKNAQDNQSQVTVQGIDKPNPGPFHLVVANIISSTIKRLLPEFASILAPGGWLIVSGILEEESDDVAAEGVKFHFKKHSLSLQDGWGCLILKK